jgi:hypothetical protein
VRDLTGSSERPRKERPQEQGEEIRANETTPLILSAGLLVLGYGDEVDAGASLRLLCRLKRAARSFRNRFRLRWSAFDGIQLRPSTLCSLLPSSIASSLPEESARGIPSAT